MSSLLEKINAGLLELEKLHGSSIPVSDVRELVASILVAPTAPAPTPVSSSAGGQCEAFTKGKDAKQCSKKATAKGTDNKGYCPQHFRINCPDAPVATPIVSSSVPATASAPAKKPSPKTTVGKGSLTPTCSYQIGGKNPRSCTATGKNIAPDGQCYCGTHFKKFEKAGSSVGVKGNDAKAESKITTDMTQPVPQIREEFGLAVDQNGICYLNEYEGLDICICGLIVAGEMVDIKPEIEEFAKEFALPIVPAEGREKIRAMTAQERKRFMSVEQSA